MTKAVCQYCGHVQILKKSLKRRVSTKGEDLFQCSRCHRYSPISPIHNKKVTSSKKMSMNEKNPLVEIASDLILKGLKKLGFIEPEPEPKKEESENASSSPNRPSWI